ncbi:hypothetical protein IEO21_03102 [Rhodonia placenta]|uniref:Signal peptidase complex subunit 1 n=2 Tax=Rhodonia placenta TaxID=104341 RepID=A0A1X6N2A4_9APHY|nr:hypothetical protein POSPLADRAFT_1065884 [Postia placenta MAD-698-R-SB12]KAF9817908.1 hypothetical protein IEO21_03102 [Postia placenta]OSX62761.1 hypothetical protein POSPLADRAFT_1065884 [Postia placenta MAD-698-R-SB12]
MLEYIQKVFEGKIDFEGQNLVEQIVRITLFAATVVSFLLGFALQSLQVTFGAFSVVTVALFLVVLPPWPMYNRYPVQWLPAQDTKAK